MCKTDMQIQKFHQKSHSEAFTYKQVSAKKKVAIVLQT